MEGAVSYAALGTRERSIVDAFVAGETWSPEYFETWLERHPVEEAAGESGVAKTVALAKTEKPSIKAGFIRAALISNILSEHGLPLTVDERGARLMNVVVEGELNLTAVEFCKPIIFEECVFKERIILEDAKLGRVSLDGSELPQLAAERVDIDGDLSLRNVKCCNSIKLREAHIRGSLSLVDTELSGKLISKEEEKPNAKGKIKYRTIDCTDAEIEGNAFLRRCRVLQGEVRFVGATIGANLFCDDAEFDCNKKCRTLYCSNTTIGASVFLRGDFRAVGEVNFFHAKIGGQLVCTGGSFDNGDYLALNCEEATIGSSVLLDATQDGASFNAKGEVSFCQARIKGQFNCKGGQFDLNCRTRETVRRSLNCNGAVIGADVFLSQITYANGKPIFFNAIGEVDFGAAVINGRFYCEGGHFSNAGKWDPVKDEEASALNCGAAEFGATVSLRDGFEAEGWVNFCRSKIKGNLGCRKGSFRAGENHVALDLRGTHIGGTLFFTTIDTFVGVLDLRDAYVAGLADDGTLGKETRGYLKSSILRRRFHFMEMPVVIKLDGFCYDYFADDEKDKPIDVSSKDRLAWLMMQPKGYCDRNFHPQPFTRCARVLRSMGHTRDARRILYEREKRRIQRREKSQFSFKHEIYWCLYAFFLGLFAGYGYKPRRALIVLFIIWLFGANLFAVAYCNGLIRVASENVLVSDWYTKTHLGLPPLDYEPFKPMVYSADVLLPIIDFSQKHSWVPRDWGELKSRQTRLALPVSMEWQRGVIAWEGKGVNTIRSYLPAYLQVSLGWLPKFYYWFEIIAGWYLTTVIVATLAGLLGNPREE